MSIIPTTADLAATEAAQRAALEDEFRRTYRAGRRNRVLLRIALNVLGVALFLAFWEAIPNLMPSINKIMFPPPSTVFAASGRW
jgi:hypothetical protein